MATQTSKVSDLNVVFVSPQRLACVTSIIESVLKSCGAFEWVLLLSSPSRDNSLASLVILLPIKGHSLT
ncbi:hypothetical protein EYC84_004600 [Monilinia fructicola]|uniref:Uncharacterized protein n=1 Tax=Monilinia fructicola TaxID=38448 RepID=A0A5M9K4S8_MONFR|nr:hypothetical protein EYC84_004600 [Monilinia fructicola]